MRNRWLTSDQKQNTTKDESRIRWWVINENFKIRTFCLVEWFQLKNLYIIFHMTCIFIWTRHQNVIYQYTYVTNITLIFAYQYFIVKLVDTILDIILVIIYRTISYSEITRYSLVHRTTIHLSNHSWLEKHPDVSCHT